MYLLPLRLDAKRV